MKELVITSVSDGQKIERVLERCLCQAPLGFLYRMMRRKNITLNGKKLHPGEKVHAGDVVQIWFSDETFAKFAQEDNTFSRDAHSSEEDSAVNALRHLNTDDFRTRIIYENEHILLMNKPAGLLTQKAKPEDLSLNEYIVAYLLQTGQTDPATLQLLRPSACNRLDRGTSGLIAAGKTQRGLEALSEVFRERSVRKEYLCLAFGKVQKAETLEAYLVKDHARNKVNISRAGKQKGRDKRIITQIAPLKTWEDYAGRPVTLLQIHLVTGRSHQIRAQLSFCGYPLIGDKKYGDPGCNRDYFDRYGVTQQMLHAYRLTFPDSAPGVLADLSGTRWDAPLPDVFSQILEDAAIGGLRGKRIYGL